MKMATCHPKSEHLAKGLCSRCYNTIRRAANREKLRDYNTAYYATHREERLVYYYAHREEIRPRRAAYCAAHKKERAAYTATYRERAMARKSALKLAALNAYGGPRCSCCGETLLEGLTIDHINGDGAAWRRENKQEGSGLYRWLENNGYPPGFQVLCATCNLAKGTGDHCPHRDLNLSPQG